MRSIEYLKLLSKEYPNIASVSSEIINLQAILNLPKATEHFLTDLHGEDEAFDHVIRTASGVLKRKIDDIFGDHLHEEDKKQLGVLIFYPEQKLKELHEKNITTPNWYKITLNRVINICKVISSKYTRSKVRKALPKDFAYIIEELLHLKNTQLNKEGYYNNIINTIIEIGRADDFIIQISYLIQRLAVDKLHIVGDIFDRGNGAHKIIERLIKHHDCDIQWGNHDILWIGAALGHPALVATAVRITLRYANLSILEDSYGINLRPLLTFAMNTYKGDPCEEFMPRVDKNLFNESEKYMIAQMHKAISIIQFKVEEKIMNEYPELHINNIDYLENINYEKGTIKLNNTVYSLTSNNFPTIDPKNPLNLTKEESDVLNNLIKNFTESEKLKSHIYFLINKGSMYLKTNGNLLFHGCIPMNEEGNFEEVEINGRKYKGRALLDKFDVYVRKSYFHKNENNKYLKWLWYLWRGEKSPLFGKNKMSTFERYFIKNKETHKEIKNSYYTLREKEEIALKVLDEFDLDEKGYIINGHTPVKVKKGESPIKANGRLLVIDGGFCRAYQNTTGIAGYTLIFNSYGLVLNSHKKFEGTKKAIIEGQDIISSTNVLKKAERLKVKNTDIGKELIKEVEDLKELLEAYKNGVLKEKEKKFNISKLLNSI
ncbi:fructose-1,6-bisphosphatase class 3 [Tepiditoga spiralis]|uniref:Fructose-1,6-bisphosphatase class 3 n=1 Tax=Tepiditoga spiralis TaxID=2108365 RepID=A0A7G1G5G6_9BACT|nr:fructose-1,6-bisphosphatase [Tepiditoga spiralis]BBE31820.1 fructose-1,6-bisphosphatase class 3 [Tepiditoga spiralis]